jgi:hypothetical protein
MYLLQMNVPATLVVTGVPVDVTSTSISLIDGWNWIGYLPQSPGDVSSALAGIGLQGLFIGSQTDGTSTNYDAIPEYAEFGLGWSGALTTLEPGIGYKLQMNGDGELVYPEFDDGAARAENKRAVVLTETISDWDFNYGDYQYVGTITVSIDSREDFDGDVVGVFVDGECRGIAERMSFPYPYDDTHFYIIQAYSNVASGEEMTFRYYDKSHDEVIEYIETVDFSDIISDINNNIVENNGFDSFGLSRIARSAPEQYSLSDAYPNPFNPTTTLSFSVKTEGHINLSIYDMTGRLVKTLVDMDLKQGYHSMVWNGMDNNGHAVSSGMYIYALQGEGVSISKKMVLMK